jgi:hypothetical protein
VGFHFSFFVIYFLLSKREGAWVLFFHFLLFFCKFKSYMDVPNLISFLNLGL